MAIDQQYHRLPSLIIHGLRDVPKNVKHTKFSIYVAKVINRLLPRLPDKVSYWDIHASHPLGKAVIVRFQRRDLRNEIYRRRFYLTDSRVSIAEHLTEENRHIFDKTAATIKSAASSSTESTNIWTDQCKIFTYFKGKKRRVKSMKDVEGLSVLKPRSKSSVPHTENPSVIEVEPQSTPDVSDNDSPIPSHKNCSSLTPSDPKLTPTPTVSHSNDLPEKVELDDASSNMNLNITTINNTPSRHDKANPSYINFSNTNTSTEPVYNSTWGTLPSAFTSRVNCNHLAVSTSLTNPSLPTLNNDQRDSFLVQR